MALVTLHPGTWKKLVALAKRQQKKPERLAERALREFLARIADEDLLDKSKRAAQRHGKTLREIDEAIKQRRRAKR
ncbi:MAG: hypothetical protein HY040_25170 [Planctomycetes bacterium]|nr:hypothetical protein [Planctomycetota bacterium]